jgi:CubicO group peptidase (beta-lactamase class C family)
MFERLTERLERARRDKIFPGYACASIDNGIVQTGAGGSFTYDAHAQLVQTDTLYDVASLTKIIGPMTVAMMLVDDGLLKLDDKIGDYIPAYKDDIYKRDVTLLHALTYTLEYDVPAGSKALMADLLGDRVAVDILARPLRCAPGTSYLYSNITAFLVTQIIERVTGQSFYDVWQTRVATPLQMPTATFTPTTELIHLIPPTEITPDRGLVQGFVHDEFTDRLRLAGIATGAAGLFASVYDLVPFLQMALGGGVYQGTRLVSEAVVSRWTNNQFPALLPVSTPLGWGDQNNELIAKSEDKLVVKSGFTGCLIVANLTKKQGLIWLSNRTYPVRPDDRGPLQELKQDLVEMVVGEG